MKPADVERLLAIAGRTVTLRRQTDAGALDLDVKAFIQFYAPQQLVGDITQGDREAKISNKEIRLANWPGPPLKGDRLVIDGRVTTIEAVDPGYIGEDIAMFTLTVRG